MKILRITALPISILFLLAACEQGADSDGPAAHRWYEQMQARVPGRHAAAHAIAGGRVVALTQELPTTFEQSVSAAAWTCDLVDQERVSGTQTYDVTPLGSWSPPAATEFEHCLRDQPLIPGEGRRPLRLKVTRRAR